MVFSTLPQTVQNTLGKARTLAGENPLAAIGIGAGVGAAVVGVGGVVVASVASRSRSTGRRRKRAKTSRGRRTLTARQRKVRRIKARPGRQSPYTAGARKDRSRTRVRYTKTGQPYKLSGKGGAARFITKRAAKASRRR